MNSKLQLLDLGEILSLVFVGFLFASVVIHFPLNSINCCSKLVKTHDDIEGDKLQQGIRASIVEIIKKREENVKTEELDSYGSHFLGNLLKAYHTKDETKKISRDVLIDECKTLYTGGYETTTNLPSWTILLLATQHRLARQSKEKGPRIIFPASPR